MDSPGIDYAIATTVDGDFDTVLEQTREALSQNGFGVLTEIDLAGTLKVKVDADIPAHVILGACRPALAHAAVQAEPSIGLLLPCNVVVRSTATDAGADAVSTVVVEAMDPQAMVTVTGNPQLTAVADDAGRRLRAALVSLTPSR